jgi:hypothetical protein
MDQGRIVERGTHASLLEQDMVSMLHALGLDENVPLDIA